MKNTRRTILMALLSTWVLTGCTGTPMNEEIFWSVVDKANKQAASTYERPERLESLLDAMPATDVLEFEKQFRMAADQAYDHKVWAAAYLLNGGCSDDCFIDFRSWLISSGRDTYSSILNDPDSAGSFFQGDDEVTLEEYGYVAWEVYKRKTGRDIDLSNWEHSWRTEPTGTQWEEDDLPKLLPNTFKVVASNWSFPEEN